MTTKHWLIGGAVAAAALLGWAAYGKVHAADLGKDGLGDLEERVAALEASSVTKGNRKVTLKLSGYVSHSVMWWDDGTKKDMYIGDGGAISSRLRLTGDAKISPELTAGFTYEFGINNNALGSMTQGLGGDDLGGNQVLLRDSTVWLKHKTLGRFKVGHGSTATDDLILIDVAGAAAVSSADPALFVGSFGTNQGLTWAYMLNGGISFDTARRNHVSWQSPSVAGFMLEGAVAENNFWDVAIKFANEVQGFRIAAGIGHSVDEEVPVFGSMSFASRKITETKGSISIQHVATGLFATGAAGQRQFDGATNAYSAGDRKSVV